MRNAVKRVICILSAICVAVSVLFVCDSQALAATAPKKAHIEVKQVYSYPNRVQVNFEEGDYKVVNVTSSSKNLVYRITNTMSSSSQYNNGTWGFAIIELYAKKKGTYTLKFDVVDRNKNVTSSHSVKVYANTENAVKSVTYNGKYNDFFTLTNKKSGKFKIKMNKGYTLKSITMVTYNKSGKEVRKKIKNGSKVTLGKYRYISQRQQSSTDDYWSASLLAQTTFEITYKDKYTGENETTNFWIFTQPKN